MKILALDSSGLVASVDVVMDDELLGEYTINHKKTHSQTLLPMLDEVVKMIELDMSTIDVIAVSAGPGSFTGLRIGSATAKGLALALDKKIVSVPTVDAIAYNMWGSADLVCPLMDARRQQVYTGLYDWGSMVISSNLGGLIGGLIGGPAGAIIGTLAGIGIEMLIQCFKDDVVNWVDKTVDDFLNGYQI